LERSEDITIAIWGDNRMLSIRCAKIKYGYNVIDDVLQGYRIREQRILLVRVSKGETSEDEHVRAMSVNTVV